MGMGLLLPLCMTVWGRVAEQACVERPQFPDPPSLYFKVGGLGFMVCGTTLKWGEWG